VSDHGVPVDYDKVAGAVGFCDFCRRQSESTLGRRGDLSLIVVVQRKSRIVVASGRREIGANGRASFKPLDPAHGVVVLLQTGSGFPTPLLMRSYDPDPSKQGHSREAMRDVELATL